MATTANQVQALYIGYMGRAADQDGLNFWTNAINTGVSTLESAALGFTLSPEYQSLYAGLTTSQLVAAVYQNVLGRAADESGLKFWVNEVNTGYATSSNLVLKMINSMGAVDQLTLDNRVAAGNAYTTAHPTDYNLADATTAVGLTPAGSVTLTNGTDLLSGNVFEAGLVYTPGGNDRINSLQDEDVLTGTGTNATLNATLGNSNDNGGTTVTPTMKGIQTVNVAFTGSGGTAVTQLDLQDTTGLSNAINITRVSDGIATALIDNIATLPTDLSVSNSGQPAQNVSFAFNNSAVSGTTDSVNLTLSNVQINTLSAQSRLPTAGFGIETVNLISTGATNSLTALAIEDAEKLDISGDQALTLQGTSNITSGGVVEATAYTAGLANVAGSLSVVDAADLAAGLNIALGAETVATKDGTSGEKVNFSYIGSAANDNVVLVNGLDAGDSLNLGAGTNSLTVLATTQTGAIINAQTLNVLNQAGAANTIGVNTGVFTGLTSIVVRNEGQAAGVSAVAPMTANLLDVNATAGADITVKHGTTGNNGLLQNILNVDAATGVTAVTVKLADGVNTNPRFNLNLTTDSDLTLNANGTIATGNNNASGANAVTTLSLVDSDTESGTIQLSAQGYTSTGALRGDSGTSYTTINLSGANQAGKFLNLDATLNAYNVSTDGTAVAGSGNRTSALVVTARDTVFSGTYTGTNYADVSGTGGSVGYGLLGSAANAAGQRLIATKIDASTYTGDVILRVGQADQAITTGTGNDTIIFDAINDTRAGLTISDTVKGGTGIDTIVLDGGMTVAAAQIVLGASEWTNLTGIDVLRLGSNDLNGGAGSGYTLTITDQLVSQTDAGNRITIINNDGNLGAATSSAATLDMRQANGLSATKFVNFYGENGDTVNGVVAAPANRVILSDATANGGHILNGGDNDLQAFATAAAWNGAAGTSRGNGNTIEYRNSSVVTAGDQAGITNFASIVFNNDQAVAQTLTLELTTAVADALADASHTAAANAQETLTIRANDASFASSAGAALSINANAISTSFILNIRTDDNANANNRDVIDTINLNANVGASSGHTVDIADGGSVADVLTFFGSTGDIWSTNAAVTVTVNGTVNNGGVVIQNAAGLSTATETLTWDNADTVRLTADNGVSFTTLNAAATNWTFTGTAGVADTINGTAGNNVITGLSGNDTINGGAGNDTITGGTGTDTLTGGTGTNVFVFAAGDNGAAPSATVFDIITDFRAGTNSIDLGATAITIGDQGTAAGVGVATVNAAGVATFNGADTTLAQHLTAAAAAIVTGGATVAGESVIWQEGADAYLFISDNVNGVSAGDVLIQLTGVTVGAGGLTITGGDITAIA